MEEYSAQFNIEDYIDSADTKFPGVRKILSDYGIDAQFRKYLSKHARYGDSEGLSIDEMNELASWTSFTWTDNSIQLQSLIDDPFPDWQAADELISDWYVEYVDFTDETNPVMSILRAALYHADRMTHAYSIESQKDVLASFSKEWNYLYEQIPAYYDSDLHGTDVDFLVFNAIGSIDLYMATEYTGRLLKIDLMLSGRGEKSYFIPLMLFAISVIGGIGNQNDMFDLESMGIGWAPITLLALSLLGGYLVYTANKTFRATKASLLSDMDTLASEMFVIFSSTRTGPVDRDWLVAEINRTTERSNRKIDSLILRILR